MRLLAACLVLALVLPGALAQQDARVRAASILVYHPSPDPRAGAPDADPLGSPAAPPPGGARVGSTLFDGIAPADAAPEGAPESALAHFREYQRLLLLRERTGAPVALDLGGSLDGDLLRFDALVAPGASAPGVPLSLAFVVFENGVAAPTPDGVRAHPYVARVALPPQPLDLAGGRAAGNGSVRLDPSWDPARVGVVAIVRATESDERYAAGEVVQSAAWLARDPARVAPAEKVVLVERVTATWCGPCRPGDEALALLASQYGADALPAASGSGYLRAPTPLALAGLAAGLGVGVALLRRRSA